MRHNWILTLKGEISRQMWLGHWLRALKPIHVKYVMMVGMQVMVIVLVLVLVLLRRGWNLPYCHAMHWLTNCNYIFVRGSNREHRILSSTCHIIIKKLWWNIPTLDILKRSRIAILLLCFDFDLHPVYIHLHKSVVIHRRGSTSDDLTGQILILLTRRRVKAVWLAHVLALLYLQARRDDITCLPVPPRVDPLLLNADLLLVHHSYVGVLHHQAYSVLLSYHGVGILLGRLLLYLEVLLSILQFKTDSLGLHLNLLLVNA